MSQRLDLRGVPCPQPVIRTKAVLEAMAEGVLEVVVDNDVARDNILRFASFKGCKAAVEGQKGAECTIRITKGNPKEEPKAPPPPRPEPSARPEPAQKPEPKPAPSAGERIVLLTTARIGDDNEALGRELMGSFLDVLTQASRLPDRLILINSAVALAAQGSPVLETLRELQEKGVQVVSCGRCLEYLHLKAKLQVGTITNMFEVVEALTSAASVVKL